MDTLPLWFLDIDGVVNAVPNKPKHRLGLSHGEVEVPHPFFTGLLALDIYWNPAVVEFINRVHREQLAEIQWLTTWGHLAQTKFAPLVGLDHFATVHEPPLEEDDPGGSEWWKISAIKKVPEISNRRFIFTDDDLDQKTRKELGEVFEKDQMLLITPFQPLGLEPHHLQKIESFLKVSPISQI